MDTLAFSPTATRSDAVAPGGEARGCPGRHFTLQISEYDAPEGNSAHESNGF
jgi:hypothetical protein